MERRPVRLKEYTRSAIWGGHRLISDWGKQTDGENLAEAWELSVRAGEMATISDGEFAGMPLDEYIRLCGGDCVSPAYHVGDRFPLLIKLIDAADTLSVQVHPDDAYAGRVEHDLGKTEMWYIVDAEPGASIVWGLRDGVSREAFAQAIHSGRIEECLHRQPVRAGECYYIPAGMLHAIGGGILIAEIQQNSDLTYRVYDYNRRGADGKLRELHVQKALDVTRGFTPEEVRAQQFARGDSPVPGGELLADSRYFRVVRYSVKGELSLCVDTESFVSLLCVDGAGSLLYGNEKYPVERGDSYFLPAGMGEYRVSGDMTLIASRL